MSTNVTEKKTNFLQGFAGRAPVPVKKETADPGKAASEPKSVVTFEPGSTPRKPAAGQPGQVDEGAQKRTQSSKLTEFLIDQEIVTRNVVQEAVDIQSNSIEKKRLIEILIEDLSADREAVLKAVSNYYSFESIDPTAMFGNKEKLQFIKQLLDGLESRHYEMAVRLKVLPFELFINGHDKLILITPDTTHPDVHVIAKAFKFPKYEIKHVPTPNWQELWRQLAFDQGSKQLNMEGEDGFESMNQAEADKEMEKSLEDEIGRGKLNELIEGVLTDGVRTGASDIHVIPKASHRTEFHFRIDGRLSLWSAVTDVRSESVITVGKDRGKNLDRFEKLLSQDGFAQRMIDNKMIRFRFSTMPIYSADLRSKLESIVIRILRGGDSATGIESLKMPDDSKEDRKSVV